MVLGATWVLGAPPVFGAASKFLFGDTEINTLRLWVPEPREAELPCDGDTEIDTLWLWVPEPREAVLSGFGGISLKDRVASGERRWR